MKEYIKIAIIALIASLIGAILPSLLVGNSTDELGGIGITRYPNSGVAARAMYVSSTIPTSITDNTFTVTGTATLGVINSSGLITSTGGIKMTSTAWLQKSASSTLQIGKVGGTTYAGCLILGDTSATTTVTYVTADSGTLTATTTQPTYCTTPQ